jgi:hypothetical protein
MIKSKIKETDEAELNIADTISKIMADLECSIRDNLEEIFSNSNEND